MPRRRPSALAILALFAAAIVVTTSGCAVWRIGQSRVLVRASEPFQRTPANPTASLLVVGDSTAVGTGASSGAASVAGLIAADHPGLRIVNRAADGARYADIVRQIEASSERFDLVLVMGGGNDVIRYTRYEELEASIDRAARSAKERGGSVILMPMGNVGNAPFFFRPYAWAMESRSRRLHEMVRGAAQATGATYVRLFKERAEDPFAQQPEVYHARDGLHPSDAGYRSWYQELLQQAGLAQKLRPR